MPSDVGPLYSNVLQEIAQLQTIFDTLIGKPTTKKCVHCDSDVYTEDWDIFMEKRLKELGIIDPNAIRSISKVKKTLNKAARVKYIHNAASLNPHDPRILPVTYANGQYETDFDQVFKKRSDSWNRVDWMNVNELYKHIVRNIIHIYFFLR